MLFHTLVPNKPQVLCILKELYKYLLCAMWYIRKIQGFGVLQTRLLSQPGDSETSGNLQKTVSSLVKGEKKTMPNS